MTELVHLDVADGVATITLDSAHNRNALSRQLVTELSAHLATAVADPAAAAVLLRSAQRVFCSGADLSEMGSSDPTKATGVMVDLQRTIVTAPKPVVVVLEGPVRAGGLGLVGAADLVIARDDVTFALTEVRLAVAAATISLTLLERLGHRFAADVFLTGRTFTATEAAEAGLITRAVPADQVGAAVEAVLADLGQGHPQGFAETKTLLNRDLVARIDALGDEVAEQSARLFASAEAHAAMLAFLERSRPR